MSDAQPRCPVNPKCGEPCACLDPSSLPDGVVNPCSAIHHHFGLSYANYMVLRRSILQSMPQAWQAKFVALLRELDDAMDGLDDPVSEYQVIPKDERGKPVDDPLSFYDRGRRRLPLKRHADGG